MWAMMAAAHAMQRVKGPASVTCEPLCGPCTSVIEPTVGVGMYASCPQFNVVAHCTPEVETGFSRWSTLCVAGYAAAVDTSLPCNSSFMPPRLVICKKGVPAASLWCSTAYLRVVVPSAFNLLDYVSEPRQAGSQDLPLD